MIESDVIQTQLDLLYALPAATEQREHAETAATKRQGRASNAIKLDLDKVNSNSRRAQGILEGVKLTHFWHRKVFRPESTEASDPEKIFRESVAETNLAFRESVAETNLALLHLGLAVAALCHRRVARTRALRLAFVGALVVLAILGYAAF